MTLLILNRREGEELRFTDPEGRIVRIVVEEVHCAANCWHRRRPSPRTSGTTHGGLRGEYDITAVP